MFYKLTFICLFFLTFIVNAQEKKNDIDQKEIDGGLVEFNSIKNILKNDQLQKVVKRKQKVIKKRKIEKIKKEQKKHLFPIENEFWSFFSEYWLVKNTQKLNWDFDRPDFGLSKSFEKILRDLGFLNRKFKILVINTSRIYHAGLPSDPGESILLISLPFIRSMDLTRREICLILFEDFIRIENKMLLKKIKYNKVRKLFGENMFGKKVNSNFLNELLGQYSTFIFKSGYTFQEQYETTKNVAELIRYDKKLWKSYRSLLTKKDKLIKENKTFSNYNDFYPSPEMQLTWIDKL
jgi:hypothetical protein